MQVLPLRLKPEADLRRSLQAFALDHQIQGGFILSAIGSLKQAGLRFADQPEPEILLGKFEILSLQGTLSLHGLHLHLLIADRQGRAIGGHLTNGSLIYTTGEIIVGICEGFTFLRTPDPATGFLELEIR